MKPPIKACALSLGIALGLAYSPASASVGGATNHVPPPPGYCVTAVKVVGDSGNNVFYKFKDQTDENGIRVGYALDRWDVRIGKDSDGKENTGYFNMSVLMAPISDAGCLTDIKMLSANRASVAPAPTAVTGKPYNGEGTWFIPEVWTPSDGRYVNQPSVTLYTQPMMLKSARVVNGVSLEYGIGCRPTSITTNGTETCLGSFKGEGGSKWYSLFVNTIPYVKPPDPTVKSMSGSWVRAVQCTGCATTQFGYETGVTSGRSVENGSETSKSLSVMASLTLSAGADGIAKQSGTVAVTGTLTDTKRQAVINSFEQADKTTIQLTCDKGAIWYWQTTANFSDGGRTTANASQNVCTIPTAVPPEGRGAINWQGG